MQKIVRIFAVILFGVLCIGISSIAEEITLTTYYPAPYGAYVELRANKLAVGSGTTMPTTDGDLNVSGTVTISGDLNAGTIDATAYEVSGTGYSGTTTFTTADVPAKTVTVTNGIITKIE